MKQGCALYESFVAQSFRRRGHVERREQNEDQVFIFFSKPRYAFKFKD